MAFGNATKGYVKAHSGGGGSGTDNYNNLSNKPKINGVALSGNKTSADLHIESGTDDYEDLTNKPSINGVELLGENVIGLLSGNIQVDYTKLTDLPSINGVTLTGNKTSSDLHISGGAGTSDYTDLTNKPSINGVELLGDKEVGLLSGNIHVDYTKLTNTPSINGVALSGNKTSAELNIETGTDDYTDLTNKPSINGVELTGNKTSADLNISGGGGQNRTLLNQSEITTTGSTNIDITDYVQLEITYGIYAGVYQQFTSIVSVEALLRGLVYVVNTIPWDTEEFTYYFAITLETTDGKLSITRLENGDWRETATIYTIYGIK